MIIAMLTRKLPALLAAAVVSAALIACNGGGDDDDPTPTAAPASPSAAATVATTPTPGVTPSGAIREIDLSAQGDVQALVSDSGGSFVQEDVLYADLTGDAIEDAVVPLSSGGTQGFVAFIVLTPDGDATSTLLREEPAGGFTLVIEGDALVMIEPVPGPSDPECCPSMLRRTTYGWNGAALAIENVATVPNPDGGAKTPSVSP